MKLFVLIEMEDLNYQTSNVCGVLSLETAAIEWASQNMTLRTYEVHILDKILS